MGIQRELSTEVTHKQTYTQKNPRKYQLVSVMTKLTCKKLVKKVTRYPSSRVIAKKRLTTFTASNMNKQIDIGSLSKPARVQYGVVLNQALRVRYIVRTLQVTSSVLIHFPLAIKNRY